MNTRDRIKMTVTFDVTIPQALALQSMFNTYNQLSNMGASRDVAFCVDGDGNKIMYNGSNIKDHEIWTTGSDFDGNCRVLILTSLS